jgi:hypothetical protein
MARLHTRPLSYWVGLVIEVRLDEGSPSRLHSCHELPSQTQLWAAEAHVFEFEHRTISTELRWDLGGKHASAVGLALALFSIVRSDGSETTERSLRLGLLDWA